MSSTKTKVFNTVVREIAKIWHGVKFDLFIGGSPSEPERGHFVQVNLPGKTGDSYLGFWYNENEKRIEYVNLSVKEEHRDIKKDLAKQLESIGDVLNCNVISVSFTKEREPWEDLDYIYDSKQDCYIKHLCPYLN